jgi:hypothetical protein
MGVERALEDMKGVSIIGHSVSSFLAEDKPAPSSSAAPSATASKPSAAAADEVMSDLLELSNGCVCCTVRSDFVVALEALLSRRRFDYVMVECSGIADPGSLARLFWVVWHNPSLSSPSDPLLTSSELLQDDELDSSVYLDSIATVGMCVPYLFVC